MNDSSLWDDVAGGYDNEAGHGVRTADEAELWCQLFVRLFPPEQPRRILDVGTGTGFVALILSELGHDVTGIDFSPGMLAIARAKAAAGALSVRFVVGDVTKALATLPDLGIPADGFDAVVSRHVVWALPDPVATIADWATVVRTGGRVVAIDGVWSATRPADRLAAWAGRWLEAARTRSRPHRPARRPDQPLRYISDPTPAREAFLRAGLLDVRSRLLPDIDRVERAGMTVTERLQNRWRRYLIQATVPARIAAEIQAG